MKNKKGFTQPFLKYFKLLLGRAGFTFVELIVATVILAIAVAGVYATFLSSAKFTGAFRHEVMAVIGAQGILDQTRAEHSNHSPSTYTYLAPIDPGDPGYDVSGEGAFTQLSGEVEAGLAATRTVTGDDEDDVDLGSGYPFRRITVTVQWNEREI